MNANQSITDAQLQSIKDRISKEANSKNATEFAKPALDSKSLQQTMQNAADNFVKQTGRNMTYSEIREMMG